MAAGRHPLPDKASALVDFAEHRAARKRHGLRTLDALQLAVASGLQRAGFTPIFVAADQKLCQAAALEDLRVTNPEQPISSLI